MDKKGKGQFTIIGEGSVIEGTVKVPHTLRIDGSVQGSIEAEGEIAVGENSVIKADIKAQNADIAGIVEGNIEIEEKIEIQSGSSIKGDISAQQLIVNEGACFNGNCSMNGDDENKI